jgi:hypothetical protein
VAGHPCTTSADCQGQKGNLICYQGRCRSCVPSLVCQCSAPYGGCDPDNDACLACCGPYCD